MPSFNSSFVFREQEFLFDDVPKEWTDPGIHEEIKITLENVFRKEHDFLESLVENAKTTILSLEDKIKFEKNTQQRKREKKDILFTKVITAKQSLDELLLKKNTLKAANIEVVSKDELNAMLQKVVQSEKEQEVRQDDLKVKVKVFIGQMSFYKEYLNIYIDISNSTEYMLYFRRCRGEDDNKPHEWIQIKTDDFKKFLVIDIASRGNENDELLKQVKSSVKHLRQLIIEARELCLNV